MNKIKEFFKQCAKDAADRRAKYTALKNSDGTKIRVQYFNLPIFALGYLVLLVLIIAPAVAIKNKEPLFTHDLLSALGTLGLLILCFVPFSLLNRFFFGKTVCVVNDKGIRLIDDFIEWSDVKEISYEPGSGGKRRYYPSHVDITARKRHDDSFAIIEHFPLYGLRLLKKRLPDVRFRFDWIMLVIPAAVFVLTDIIILLSK